MKKHLMIALIGIALLLATVPALRGEEAGPEALIARARAVVLSPHFSREAINGALLDVLDASLLILPRTDRTKECRSRIEEAKKPIVQGELFSEKAYGDLGLAYKSVSGGTAWKIPEELTAAGAGSKGIEQATKICAKLLDSALAAHKAGRSEESVRDLLGMVILIVTPIEAGR
ncbi:MAG: hypothetical protein H6P95_1850 [Candidatus Aminicenantes bacterium]|nr:hypothetical protein [Candidatus Aminicenantes bacterium]